MPPALRFALLCCCALPTLAACGSPFRMPEAIVSRASLDVPFAHVRPHRLEVRIHRGLALVRPGRELSCRVDVTVRAADEAQARARADSVRVVLDEDDPLITRLRVSHAIGAALDDVSLRYDLVVPSSVDLQIESGSADVALTMHRGNSLIRTESGNIRAALAGGSCRLVTETGAIQLRGEFLAAELETRSGRIEATLPRQQATTVLLTARSHDGALQLDVAKDLSVELDVRTQGSRVAVAEELGAQWQDIGTTQDDNTQLYRAHIGTGELPRARLLVESGTGNVEVRRLAEGGRQ